MDATRIQNTTPYSADTIHIKQHRSKGVEPNSPPPVARRITVALDMSKAFDTMKHGHTYPKAATDQDSRYNH